MAKADLLVYDKSTSSWITISGSGSDVDTSTLVTKEEFNTKTTEIETNKIDRSELSKYVSKEDLGHPFKHMGSVDTYAMLPTDAQPNQMYNVKSTGMNYIWTGTEWDSMGQLTYAPKITVTGDKLSLADAAAGDYALENNILYIKTDDAGWVRLTGKDGEPGKEGARGQDGVDGRPGLDGTPGIDGKDGKSAYQIWKEAGNVGTEQDFLNLLKTKEIYIGPDEPTDETIVLWFDTSNFTYEENNPSIPSVPSVPEEDTEGENATVDGNTLNYHNILKVDKSTLNTDPNIVNNYVEPYTFSLPIITSYGYVPEPNYDKPSYSINVNKPLLRGTTPVISLLNSNTLDVDNKFKSNKE